MSELTLSQQYIEHLRHKVKDAENDYKEAVEDQLAAKSYHDSTVEWHGKLDGYFKKLEATDKAYKDVDAAISKLLPQAQTVNTNVENISEAVTLLACNALYVGREADKLTLKFQSIKNDIDNAAMTDKNLKPNAIMGKINQLGGADGKITKAADACSAALTKALELLKAVYGLHYGMDSENRTGRTVHRHEKVLSDTWEVTEEKTSHIVIYEQIECIVNGMKKDLPGGLEWMLGQLQCILKDGIPMPKIDRDNDHYPCSQCAIEKPSGNFPLAGDGSFYDQIKAETAVAKDKKERAERKLAEADRTLQRAQSSFDGFKAALAAAEAAKNGKK
jgi:hypothetical protein